MTAADHVVVSKDWFSKLPPIYPEEARLLEKTENATDLSRLAAVIKLEKHHDGITVYIPPDNESYKQYNS